MKADTAREKEPESYVPPADRSDAWLLQRWKEGDEQAAAILYDRYAMRMVALVASRLNRRFNGAIDPEEIAQSAMASFFKLATQSRLHVSDQISLWRLLATFARRKMARSVERQSAAKRGGGHNRVDWEQAEGWMTERDVHGPVDGVSNLLDAWKNDLPAELYAVAEGLLAGQSQKQVAESLSVDERTVRRRLARIRHRYAAEGSIADKADKRSQFSPSLPRVSYREFVLGKLIGSGGFGKVYRAAMQSEGRIVAVKFLRKAFWEKEGARQAFLREMELAARIDHPGVLRYLGFGESPHGGPYVVSEWIDGSTLARNRDASIERFSRWLIEICEAIDAVHQAGLVHGDLTPSNVLVDTEGRIVISDFGFSRATASATSTLLGGTLGFAAPEQLDGAFGTVSEKTDIYAIGGLIHWYLYGRPPNAVAGAEASIARTLTRQDFELTEGIEVPAGILTPPAFGKILLATLRKAPADRSVSIREILALLSLSL